MSEEPALVPFLPGVVSLIVIAVVAAIVTSHNQRYVGTDEGGHPERSAVDRRFLHPPKSASARHAVSINPERRDGLRACVERPARPAP